MCFEQILYRIGIKHQHHLIRIVSIFHFSDFIGIPKDVLPLITAVTCSRERELCSIASLGIFFHFSPLHGCSTLQNNINNLVAILVVFLSQSATKLFYYTIFAGILSFRRFVSRKRATGRERGSVKILSQIHFIRQ